MTEPGQKSTNELAVERTDLATMRTVMAADLSNSVNIVRDMRWAPISPRLMLICLAAAMLPLAPVLLLKYPITDLARNLFTGLLGI